MKEKKFDRRIPFDIKHQFPDKSDRDKKNIKRRKNRRVNFNKLRKSKSIMKVLKMICN